MADQPTSGIPKELPAALRSAFERSEHPFLVWDQIQRIPEEIASYGADPVLEAVEKAGSLLQEAAVLHAIGCGTSLFAASIAPYLFAGGGRTVAVGEAFAFQPLAESLPSNAALLAISHTGGTAAVLDACERVQRRGTKVIGLTDDPDSPLARQADAAVIGPLGPEPCLPKSRSYVGTVVKEYLIAAALGEVPGALGDGAPTASPLRSARETVLRLAEHASQLLGRAADDGRAVAEAMAAPASGSPPDRPRRIWVIGSGPNGATAAEAALKLQEMAQEPALGFELEEVMHGPWVMMNPQDLVVVVRVGGHARAKMDRFCQALGPLGVMIWDLSDEAGAPEWAFRHTTLPRLPEVLTPILSIVPIYLFTYEYARLRGRRPDSMRLYEAPYLETRLQLPR